MDGGWLVSCVVESSSGPSRCSIRSGCASQTSPTLPVGEPSPLMRFKKRSLPTTKGVPCSPLSPLAPPCSPTADWPGGSVLESNTTQAGRGR